MADEKASFEVSLKDAVSRSAKKAARGVDWMLKGFGKADKASQNLGGALAPLDGGFRQAARGSSFLADSLKLEALKGAANAVVGLGASLFQSAAFTDQMTLAFDQLTHGHGAETLDHTRRMAELLGLDVHDTTKAYKNFLALQFNPAMADKLLLMGGDMQALGSSAEEVQGIFTALGQIKSKGRLQGEELLQLQERGISGELVKQELQKQLGLDSIADVDKLQQAGKISADDFFVAFEKAINRKLGQSEVGETGKKFAEENIAGMVGVIKAKATNLWDGLIQGGAMDEIKNALRSTAKEFEAFVLSPQGAATIRGVSSAVVGLFHVAGTVLPMFVSAFGTAVDVVQWAGDHAVPLLSASLVLLAPAGFSAAAAGWAAASAWLAATAPLLLLAAAVGLFTYAFTEALKVDWAYLWGDIKAGALGLWEAIKGTAAGVWEWASGVGKSIVDGITAGIKAYFMLPVQAIQWLSDNVLGAAKNALGIASPSKEFEQLGLYSGQGFTDGLTDSMPAANDVFPDFMTASSRMAPPDFGGVSGGGRGGNVVHLTVNVNATGGDAEAIAAASVSGVRDVIHDMLNEFADESAA